MFRVEGSFRLLSVQDLSYCCEVRDRNLDVLIELVDLMMILMTGTDVHKDRVYCFLHILGVGTEVLVLFYSSCSLVL